MHSCGQEMALDDKVALMAGKQGRGVAAEES